jgi:GNAT superfamily N-acetyltransferase
LRRGRASGQLDAVTESAVEQMIRNLAETAGIKKRVYVDPEHQGEGIGRSLLTRAQEQLAEFGFVRAVLWVLPGNARARRFYEAAGWAVEPVERSADVLGVTVMEVQYRRTLP